jgi:methionine sulfoxide reductase heme-binding subunit
MDITASKESHVKRENNLPAPRPTPLPLADMGWLLVGALAVSVVLLAIGATLLIRSFSGDITLAWFISRGAGISAYLIITGSMIYGLMISTRTATGAVPAPVTFGMHEFVSWLGLIFAAAHAVVLMWDAYIKYTPATILVPFTSSYRTVWVGVGQIAFYISALVVASFYARKRIGQKAWRAIHYISFLTFIMVTLHGFYSGTDSKTLAMQMMYLTSASAVIFLTTLRIFTRRGRKPQATVAATSRR